MRTESLRVLAATLLGGVLVAGCGRQETANSPNTIAAQTPPATAALGPAIPDSAWVTVGSETLRRYAPAIGSLRARQCTRVGPQVSGRVADVLADVGDRVTKDQVLVRLDPSLFEIEVQQQRAAVAAAHGALAGAEADLAYWRRELARQQDLLQRGAGSQKDLDDARTACERAGAARDEKQGKLAEAEQKLAYAEKRLAETEIRAPYTGVITERLIDPGDMASSNPVTELLEVREIDVLYLEFSLPQEFLGVVHVNTPLEFDMEGVNGGGFHATVAVVFPAIDETTRSFRCRAVIPNEDHGLQPGALVRVRVVERQVSGALVVPRKALAPTAVGWQVFVSNDGHPVPRAVHVGLMTDGLVEIVDGLAAGERVLAAPDLAR